MKAWDEFLKTQEKELGIETVTKWLRPLKVLRFDAANLFLEAQDSFQAMWFDEHIRKVVEEKFRNNNNRKIKVKLSISAEKEPTPKRTRRKDSDQINPPTPKFKIKFDDLDPSCTFDSYVLHDNHIVPYRLLCELTAYDPDGNPLLSAPPPAPSFNPIYLYGNMGSGKTHLMMALGSAWRKRGLNVTYARSETFTEHLVGAIRAGEMNLFREAYRSKDALLLDDVHLLSRKGATQEELFHTFNTLHLAGKPIILSANCAPQELQFIEPRLVSRFEWGIVLGLEPLNEDGMMKLLQKKAEALNYPLNPKICLFLVQMFRSNSKALVRALEALILRSHLSQEGGRIAFMPLTIPLVKHYLADLIAEEEQNALTPQKIVQTVSEVFGVRVDDIMGKAQSRDCTQPRQIAMWLCRSELKLPYTKIGDLFGRDHSTVMTSVKSIQKEVDRPDSESAGLVIKILKKAQAAAENEA